MAKLDAFRKLIREEVRQVIQEELRKVLLEGRVPPKVNGYTSTLKETVKKELPKTKPRPSVAPTVSSDPLQQLLAETAFGMQPEEYRTLMSAGSDAAQGFPQMFQEETFNRAPEPQVVESVSDMLANARPTTDINQVEIDTVPDFSNLMQTLKEKGQI